MVGFLSVCALAATTACGGGDTPDNTGGAVTCQGVNVVGADANNYSFSSTLTFPPVSVKPKADLNFDWSQATADLIGHTISPTADLNTIMILGWTLPLADLQSKLNADTLEQKDTITVPLTLMPASGATSAKLFNFTLNGGTLDPAMIMPYFDSDLHPPAMTTYTMMAATGTTLGQGTRMIQSFVLDPSSSNVDVKMTPQSTKLVYNANLRTLKATGITAGKANVTLDWGDVKRNALGATFISLNITSAIVGHYKETPAELEKKFLDLDQIAMELYEGDIPSGSTVDFSMLKTKGGQAFPGIDATGTWIVALRCGGCRNPAPWYLSVLKPCQ